MSSHINCEVIRDLLPPYADGLASASSRSLVDEHLGACESCRKALEQLQDEEQTTPVSPGKALVRVKKQINKKRLLVALLAAVSSMLVAFFGFYLVMVPYAMRYNPELFANELITVEESDSWGFKGLFLEFHQGNNRHFLKQEGHIEKYDDIIVEDGKEIHVVYMTWYRNGFDILRDIFIDSRDGNNSITTPWHNMESDMPFAVRLYYYPRGDMYKHWMGSAFQEDWHGWSQRTPVLERSHLIWEWDVEKYGEPADLRSADKQ